MLNPEKPLWSSIVLKTGSKLSRASRLAERTTGGRDEHWQAGPSRKGPRSPCGTYPHGGVGGVGGGGGAGGGRMHPHGDSELLLSAHSNFVMTGQLQTPAKFGGLCVNVMS